MLLVHHFELGNCFLGLIDALLAEVALAVNSSCMFSIILTSYIIVCTYELLHDFKFFLMGASLLMHLLEIGSILVVSGLHFTTIIE